MGPQDDVLALAATCLQRLRQNLISAEQQVRESPATDVVWYARQLSDFQCQVVIVADQIATLQPQPQPHRDPPFAGDDRDRCWHALKVAVQIYRSAGPNSRKPFPTVGEIPMK
tara:strand:- start:1260 stop:1598 length:339 start_codon:yes stop_codon:yes gene_type:complete